MSQPTATEGSPVPQSPERAALEALYSTNEKQGLPAFLAELYPHYMHSLHYLGTAGSCPNGGAGLSYRPWDWEADWCVTLVRVVDWGTPETPVPTALYRLFGKAEDLLYIGVSVSPEQRWVHHSENKPWWPEVARIEFAWHSSRDVALQREAESIRAEKPRYNVQHNGRRTAVAAPQ